MILGVAGMIVASSFALMFAMDRMPKRADSKPEFSTILRHYFTHRAYVVAEAFVIGALVVTAIGNIVQTAQILDELLVQIFGNSCAVQFSPSFEWAVCRHNQDDITVFGDGAYVFSSGFGILAVLAFPLSVWNLDDNIFVQTVAVILVVVAVLIMLPYIMAEGDFSPDSMPVVGSQVNGVLGCLLFNYGLPITLPSWVNEKAEGVDKKRSVLAAMLIATVVYAVVGIIGAISFAPYFETDDTLFTKLSQMQSAVAWFIYFTIPIANNLTSIPVMIIFIRYNLIQDGVNRKVARLLSLLVWVAAVPLYTGQGFGLLQRYGGGILSSTVNIFLPAVLFMLAVRPDLTAEGTSAQYPARKWVACAAAAFVVCVVATVDAITSPID